MLVTRFKWTRRLGMLLGVSVFLFYGCNSGAPQQAPAATPGVKAAVSINAVMVALVDHAGHVVWNAEQEGRAPKTDEAWEDLEHHAMQIASAGTLIALGGTGKADLGWAQLPDWKAHAQALTDAGLAALKAVHGKNLEALVKANGQLVEVCERCHKEFKPELPTEGIVHPHHAQ